MCCFNLNMIKWDIFELLNPTDLKSRYDEEKSLREAADQRLSKLTEQLQKEKQENERLQTELVQHTLQFLLVSVLFSPGLTDILCSLYRSSMNVVLWILKE